jgi:FlaA1/EpsC-like NDP-sugar epimerase
MGEDATTGDAGRAVLITGAGGSIGAALARAVRDSGPRALVLVESSEQNLYEIDSELSGLAGPRVHEAALGDVGDEAFLAEVLEAHRPEVIYHAAAFKHVPLMEGHPVAAARNNALATGTLARLAVGFSTKRLVMVSTDKAVDPVSVMGAAKRVGELALAAAVTDDSGPTMKALRLGNVLESRGSVTPLFRRQIAAGTALTVTHPEVQRYMLTLADSVDLILRTARLEGPGGVFVPVLGPPVRILDLARDMLRSSGRALDDGSIVFTGLRPGDKISEELVSSAETALPTPDSRVMRVEGPRPDPAAFARGMVVLAEAVDRRDAASVVEALEVLVPGYRPSAAVLDAIGRSAAEMR